MDHCFRLKVSEYFGSSMNAPNYLLGSGKKGGICSTIWNAVKDNFIKLMAAVYEHLFMRIVKKVLFKLYLRKCEITRL